MQNAASIILATVDGGEWYLINSFRASTQPHNASTTTARHNLRLDLRKPSLAYRKQMLLHAAVQQPEERAGPIVAPNARGRWCASSCPST